MQATPDDNRTDAVRARQALMRLCAEAKPEELAAIREEFFLDGPIEDLRRPDTGLVMLRGRIGGEGRAFNLGEATVTRAAVRLENGLTGFSWHLGRNAAKARDAAILDALWQDDRRRPLVEEALRPVARRLEQERALDASRVAATKVNFFTMVRGED